MLNRVWESVLMDFKPPDRFLDKAEQAVRSIKDVRDRSEKLFLQQLRFDLGWQQTATGLTPANLFRMAMKDRHLKLCRIVATELQKPEGGLRVGDWMLRRVPGIGDSGHVAMLASADLLTPSLLAFEGISGEGCKPGYYGLVIEGGVFPHTREEPFARRFLDARGRVPANTVILRPELEESNPYGHAEDLPTEGGGDPAGSGPDSLDSDGPSTETALIRVEDAVDYDPAQSAGNRNDKLAQVWPRSDRLLRLLTERKPPDRADRFFLGAELTRQLPTLFIYGQVKRFMALRKEHATPSETITLYTLLFPGEARDNTGIKDLNDKVLGDWWNAQYIARRNNAINEIFNADGFLVAGGNYKTAYILTFEKTRKDFAAKLSLLDNKLQEQLLIVLQQAEDDKDTKEEYREEIRKTRKKVSKKGYRFDIFFGIRALIPMRAALQNTYLLVTEALKGAGLARYVAKANTLSRAGRDIAAMPRIKPDSRNLDPRGKEYDWNVYLAVSNHAEKIKDMVLKGEIPAGTMELNAIYVDTVWTFAFIPIKNLYWGNPDVIRDVRKKKLEPPPLTAGGSGVFRIQKDLLELWLVILNMLDYVKQFVSSEFDNNLLGYHDRALELYLQVTRRDSQIDWDELDYVYRHDVQLKDPIAVNGTASEFQFYCTVSNYQQRIFFSMDIRDLGVELMLDYEDSNREIGYRKYSDLDLMQETFRSSDPTDERRRFTYNTTVAIFRRYYNQLKKNIGPIFQGALDAFGPGVDDKLGSFAESVQIMLGGDEVYVATHPLFAMYVPLIIAELTQAPHDQDRTIDMRASVAFSRAEQTDAANQRSKTQLAHQEALKLAGLGTGLLKPFERTHRRIERLIDMIEANPKKQVRAAGYRKKLASLPLRAAFARLKRGSPKQLSKGDFARLYAALAAGDLAEAEKTDFELVDFSGIVVNSEKLVIDASALEQKIRNDVGSDNRRLPLPPIFRVPKWLLDLIKPKKPKDANAQGQGSGGP